MDPDVLEGPVRAVGGTEAVPETLTLEEVRRWCEREEKTLRMQQPEGRLAPDDEVELARLEPSTMTGALRRWAYLKHLFLRRAEQARRKDAEAQEAARQLLRREPVWVRLGSRRVAVTARSYSAMYEIASHWAQIRALEADLEVAARLSAVTEARLRRSRGWRRSARLRGRLRRLAQLHARAYAELQAHRQALYAHALTPSGAPARTPEEVPAWWREIDPADDARLLSAVIEAGHGRYARLGEPPAPAGGERDGGEDFGWASLFASIERQQRVPAAALYDQDLFQLRTWLRAGAPPAPELDD